MDPFIYLFIIIYNHNRVSLNMVLYLLLAFKYVLYLLLAFLRQRSLTKQTLSGHAKVINFLGNFQATFARQVLQVSNQTGPYGAKALLGIIGHGAEVGSK